MTQHLKIYVDIEATQITSTQTNSIHVLSSPLQQILHSTGTCQEIRGEGFREISRTSGLRELGTGVG